MKPIYSEPHSRPAPAPSGMKCPECANFIPVSIHQLLHESGIKCPYCGLSMVINKTQSRTALEALSKVEHAVEEVRKTETFRR